MKLPTPVDVLRSDQLPSQRLNDEGLPSIEQHPIPHFFQHPPNGRSPDTLVAGEIRIEHVRTVLQFHPLWRHASHAATRVHTHLRRIELPQPEQVEHRFTVLELPFSGKHHGNRRLGEQGRRHVSVGVDNVPVPRSAPREASFRTSIAGTAASSALATAPRRCGMPPAPTNRGDSSCSYPYASTVLKPVPY